MKYKDALLIAQKLPHISENPNKISHSVARRRKDACQTPAEANMRIDRTDTRSYGYPHIAATRAHISGSQS